MTLLLSHVATLHDITGFYLTNKVTVVLVSQNNTVLYLLTKDSGTLVHMLDINTIEHVSLTLSIMLLLCEVNKSGIVAILMLHDSL